MSTTSTPTVHDLVSVVIPIFNVESTLDACLRSVEAQTHRELEIICVNDGPTDGSAAIARARAARDARYVIIDKPNEGYGASCNRGIGVARGAWVAIVEPDDTVEPDWVEGLLTCAACYDGTAGVDVVKAPYWRVFPGEDGGAPTRVSCPYQGRVCPDSQPFAVGDGIELMLHHPAIWSALYRRGYLVERGIRFLEIPGAGWADNPFLVETLCQAKAIVYLDHAYYNYRRDLPGSTRHHKTAEAVERPFDRWHDMLDVLKRLGVTDERIIASHYVRGFNYARGAMYDDGAKNPLVVKRIKQMVEAMDPGIVERSPRISPYHKKFFCEQRGIPYGKSRAAYILDELRFSLKSEGFRFVLDSAVNHFTGRYMPED